MTTSSRLGTLPDRGDIKELLLNPILLLPLISAVSYLLAYMFEASYLAYFEIGHQFVEIPINTFVLSVCMVVGLIFFVSAPIMLFFAERRPDTTPRRLIGLPLAIIFVVILMMAYSIYLNTSLWASLLVLASGLAGILTTETVRGWPYFVQAFKKYGFGKKFIGKGYYQYVRHDRLSKKTPGPLAEKLFALVTVFIFALVLASLGVICGRLYAYSRHSFLAMTQNGQQYVLIRSYSDRMVFSSVSKTGQLTGNVMVLTPKDGLPLVFSRETISNLGHQTVSL